MTYIAYIGIACAVALGIGIICAICYWCGCCKKTAWTQPETPGPSLEVVDPIEVVVGQVAVVEPSQPVTIQNTESLKDKNQEINDLPTFDEALKMEIVKTDNFQSKVKKHRNDELPDYETHEC